MDADPASSKRSRREFERLVKFGVRPLIALITELSELVADRVGEGGGGGGVIVVEERVFEALNLLTHAVLHLLSVGENNSDDKICSTRLVFLAAMMVSCTTTGDESHNKLSNALSWTLMTIVNIGGIPVVPKEVSEPHQMKQYTALLN